MYLHVCNTPVLPVACRSLLVVAPLRVLLYVLGRVLMKWVFSDDGTRIWKRYKFSGIPLVCSIWLKCCSGIYLSVSSFATLLYSLYVLTVTNMTCWIRVSPRLARAIDSNSICSPWLGEAGVMLSRSCRVNGLRKTHSVDDLVNLR